MMMTRERKKIQRIRNLVNQLLAGDQPPSDYQECPNCGGRLDLRYEAYYRKDWMLGIQVNCKQCMINLAMDRGAPIPEWAKPITDSELNAKD
jgi:ssDNA-binding Zn-finger/Zn-ribbon topoisomerase 1